MTSSNHTPLAGQVALITGASRGIGLAIAKKFSTLGANVVLTARKDGPLQDVIAEFPAGKASGIAGKADDDEHRAKVFDQIAEKFGRLDILVNNAGINPVYGPLIDIELAAARKISEVNVLGTLAWSQGAYHHGSLRFAQNRGRILNISSVAGVFPPEGIGFYGVTKAAIDHLTAVLANELGPEIRVNAIAPAVVKTDFAKTLYSEGEEKVATTYPLKRLGEPADIAEAAAFLVDPLASSWITGQSLIVDGGKTLRGGLL